MAEDNSDQNIAQPQNGTQQTAPQTPSENVADEAQTSAGSFLPVGNLQNYDGVLKAPFYFFAYKGEIPGVKKASW